MGGELRRALFVVSDANKVVNVNEIRSQETPN